MGLREVVVETTGSETQIRHLREWIEMNRQWVLEASEGTVGYVHVPDAGVSGQTELVRQLDTHNLHLVVDERFNTGGQLPTALSRSSTGRW